MKKVLKKKKLFGEPEVVLLWHRCENTLLEALFLRVRSDVWFLIVCTSLVIMCLCVLVVYWSWADAEGLTDQEWLECEEEEEEKERERRRMRGRLWIYEVIVGAAVPLLDINFVLGLSDPQGGQCVCVWRFQVTVSVFTLVEVIWLTPL